MGVRRKGEASWEYERIAARKGMDYEERAMRKMRLRDRAMRKRRWKEGHAKAIRWLEKGW